MYKLTYFLRDYIFLFSFTVADKGSKTFLSGEMYCSFRNRANSKTNTKIQNKKNSGKLLQIQKRSVFAACLLLMCLF